MLWRHRKAVNRCLIGKMPAAGVSERCKQVLAGCSLSADSHTGEGRSAVAIPLLKRSKQRRQGGLSGMRDQAALVSPDIAGQAYP
jgi:hypothetical protein